MSKESKMLKIEKARGQAVLHKHEKSSLQQIFSELLKKRCKYSRKL